MSSSQAQQLMYFLLDECFNITKDEISAKSHSRDPCVSMQAIQLCNLNLCFMQATAAINQHLPYAFEWVLEPARYQTEWRLLVSVYLDYLEFKKEREPEHHAAVASLKKAVAAIQKLTREISETKSQIENKEEEVKANKVKA